MKKQLSLLKDKAVVQAFVSYLASTSHPNLTVDEWPDSKEPGEIDAIAGNFAIEHTSIDTVPNQRRDGDWLMQALGDLEKEISPQLSFYLHLVLPYDAIRQKQNWTEIKSALQKWILKDSSSLSDGNHNIQCIARVPFSFNAVKSSSRAPSLSISRVTPEDDTLAERIKKAFGRKASKLGRYKDRGFITILLIESYDIALMNEFELQTAMRIAYPDGKPKGVDQIWFADTSIQSHLIFEDYSNAL